MIIDLVALWKCSINFVGRYVKDLEAPKLLLYLLTKFAMLPKGHEIYNHVTGCCLTIITIIRIGIIKSKLLVL